MNSTLTFKAEPFLSVVISTYNRGRILSSSLEALVTQTYSSKLFEVIVIVDGSTDDTMDRLKKFFPPFEFKFFYQENRGASASRNRGAKEARGEIILFLDDDIIADKELLSEHAKYKREEPMILLGKIGVHPSSPENFLKVGVEKWSEEQFSKLEQEGYKFSFKDIYFANASINKNLFLRTGGFDEAFNSYGEEDREFALRLLKSGVLPLYSPKAIGYQYYDKDFKRYCNDFFSIGKADLKFYLKHKELKQDLRFFKYSQGSKKLKLFKKAFTNFPNLLKLSFYFLKNLMQMSLRMRLKGNVLENLQILLREFYYLDGLREACGSKERFLNLIDGV